MNLNLIVFPTNSIINQHLFLQFSSCWPFSYHIILHKLYSQDWNLLLETYKSYHPDVLIIDSPAAIRRLHHRISMLDVNHLPPPPPPPPSPLPFGIPNQVVINTDVNSDSDSELLKFPVIAKPLLANGTANSHQLCLAFNSDALKNVQPPVVLQEFVNHGGFLFKVYVSGFGFR